MLNIKLSVSLILVLDILCFRSFQVHLHNNIAIEIKLQAKLKEKGHLGGKAHLNFHLVLEKLINLLLSTK